MKPLGIWTRCRLCCRGQDWGLRCCLAHKLPGEFLQRLHPACSLLSVSGLHIDTVPGDLCLCLDLSFPRQLPQQESLCVFALCLPQALSAYGSQLRASESRCYVWSSEVLSYILIRWGVNLFLLIPGCSTALGGIVGISDYFSCLHSLSLNPMPIVPFFFFFFFFP